MARRSTGSAPVQSQTQMSALEIEQGIARLKKRLEEVESFEPTSVTEQYNIPHVEALSASVDDALMRTFGAGTLDYDRYSNASRFDNGPYNYAFEVQISEVHASLARSKATSIALLKAAIANLEERRSELSSETTKITHTKPHLLNKKVFIVHGHDGEAKSEVARFIEKLGLEPIILNEQVNKGQTIIEKIAANADVGFAIILLTPDDEGGKKGETPQPRARQNVILELGYFLAKLGRDRVCALHRGNVEVPSDFNGVVYEIYDDHGGWRSKLAKELRSVGFSVDLNQI